MKMYAMQVLMIRHSFAAAPGSVPGGDSQRPLTDRGRRVFSKMATWLVERGVVPERILYSPLVRARQTAALFAEACGGHLSAEDARQWIGSGMPLEELLKELRSQSAETLAIIGHEPRMSWCTSAMVAGGKLRFQPATVAGIRFDGPIAEAQGVLEWMLSPSQFPAG